MESIDHKKYVYLGLYAVFIGGLLIFLYLYATRPITDPDFWWHLKSGQTMIDQGAILESDPFTFTDDGVTTVREKVILRGYWLWQTVAFGLYRLFGFQGIFILNALTIGGAAAAVLYQMHRQRVKYAIAAPLTLLGFYVFSLTYPLERPQVVSFLFSAMLLGFLLRVRDQERLGWPLPLLMALWANLHGGYIVGVLIMACFGLGSIIEYRRTPEKIRHILIWISLGIGASLLNPNGALVFAETFSFHNSAIMMGINEYQSTLVKFHLGFRYVAILWLLILLFVVGVISSRRFYWPEILIAAFLGCFSFSYMRNIGFFSLAMLPLIGSHLSTSSTKLPRHFKVPLSFFSLTACSLLLLLLSYSSWAGNLTRPLVRQIYPEKAITFLKSSGLRGRMFNSYEYGGYLLWRLAPRISVFIDGRGMDPQVYQDYKAISSASPFPTSSGKEYEALLEHYGIDYVIQPIYQGDGSIQPLMINLLAKSDWVPIYLDSFVYILAKTDEDNASIVRNHAMSKSEFKTRLLLIINYLSQTYPKEAGFMTARTGMLIYLSKLEEATAQIEELRTLAPNDPSLPRLTRDLNILIGKRLLQ